MRRETRRKLDRLAALARIKRVALIGACCLAIAALLIITVMDDHKAAPPLDARLLSRRLLQDEVQNRWFWLVETEAGEVYSVRERPGLEFVAGEWVCVGVWTGTVSGLHRRYIESPGRCPD